MKKYEDVKSYLDRNSNKCADDFDNISDYHLMVRIGQMYRELEQIKLSYERVLKKEFKGELIRQASQARQTLYNTRSGNPRKQDLINGINYAIKDLDKILVLKEVE
jgi:hypothetical protein